MRGGCGHADNGVEPTRRRMVAERAANGTPPGSAASRRIPTGFAVRVGAGPGGLDAVANRSRQNGVGMYFSGRLGSLSLVDTVRLGSSTPRGSSGL